MKIAIISDSHDNIPNIEKTLDWIAKEKIKMIIHCGDVSTAQTLEILTGRFPGPIHLVLGNIDTDLKNFSAPNLTIWEEAGEIEIEAKKIAFAHFPEKTKELTKSGKYDLIFYGHIHRPWEKRIGICHVVNPGNLAGLFYKATFAVYDTTTDKLELKILEKLE